MSEAISSPDRDRDSKSTARFRTALVLSASFPLLAGFFAAWYGLFLAIAIVGLWWLIGVPRSFYWLLSVIGLAVTPFAVWIQGLPQTRVVGSNFGVRHWLANDIVIASLCLAAFVSLTEILGLQVRRSSKFWSAMAKLAGTWRARARRIEGDRGGDDTEAHPSTDLFPKTNP